MKFMLNIFSGAANIQNPRSLAVVRQKKEALLVIVVESDQEKCQSLKSLLDLYQLDVLTSDNGEEAIDLAVLHHPQMIIINTDLAELDGFETVRLLRTIKTFDQMPIIFLSDQTERIFRKKAFEVGGNAFHLEPLDIERLDEILGRFLFVD
jgi:DNA-binding response OmpR family regulator